MSVTNFISTVWSENLYTSLDKRYVAVANCSRDYEGEIRGKGSVVKICGVGEVNVGDYTKNTDMTVPQTLSDTVRELKIDQAKFFNFQIDDIDRAQSSPKLMDAAMKIAADALANQADRYVYSLYDQAGNSITVDHYSSNESIINKIIEARRMLYEANVSNASDIVVEVSPVVAELLLKEKIALAPENGESLETGCIGSIAGCKIFVSNNIAVHSEGSIDEHKCLIRTKRAIAFAEQLSEIDAYRPETRFADAVKGLHLYGAKVVYPFEMVTMTVSVNNEM